MKQLRTILFISRPRFWGYLVGPYVIGYVAGIQSIHPFTEINFFIHFFYFLIVANILVYGVNDLFDKETDVVNSKKNAKEYVLERSHHNLLKILLGCCITLTVLFIFLQPNLSSSILLLLFLILAISYSAPPIRFKSKIILDFSSNILYAVPGFLAFNQLTGILPSYQVIFSAFCWTSAMHLFSAIPDIVPDRTVGIRTSAVWLGQKKSLLLCSVLWLLSILPILSTLYPYSLLGFIYPLIPLYLYKRTNLIQTVYWKFPVITVSLGFLLFFVLLFSKIYVLN